MADLPALLARRRVIVVDGACGTMLQSLGLAGGAPPEEWNLSHPDRIAELHRAYVAAGADVITTNTFGATAIRLAEYGLARHQAKIIARAVRAARTAAGHRCLVAGCIGPTGRLMMPHGDLTRERASTAFADQARLLARAGVDVLLIETMTDLAELRAALLGIRRASRLPVIAEMSFEGACTSFGTEAGCAAAVAEALGAVAFGANCGVGPHPMPVTIRHIQAASSLPIIIQPNAGLPGGRVVGPRAMARWAQRFVELGATLVGSCCGSTPEHTWAIVRAVRTGRPRPGIRDRDRARNRR